MSTIQTFTPVSRQSNRHDGWTAKKQTAFIDALAEYGIVRAAAQKVGMGVASAYRLRDADGASEFADAWDRALNIGFAKLQDIAMDRVINGVAIPHYYKGEQVGERRWYDNGLLMFMLRQTHTRRFGRLTPDIDFADMLLSAERASAAKQAAMIMKLRGALESYQTIIDIEYELPLEKRSPDLDGWIEKRDHLADEIEKRGG